MPKWIRRLSSGQQVSYDDLPFDQVVALATALDEWENLLNRKKEKAAHGQAHRSTGQSSFGL